MKLPGAVKTGVRGLAMMPSVAAYESQKAQSFSQIGQAIGGAVDKIEQQRYKVEQQDIKIKEDKARDFAIEQNNQFSEDFAVMDRQLRQESKTGDEYEQKMITFMESSRVYAGEIAGDEYQAEAAQNLFSDIKAKKYGYITRTAQDLNKAYSTGLVNDLINTEVGNVYNDPDMAEQSLKLSIAAIDSSQLTEIEKQEKKRMVRNDIGYIKITSIADSDPEKAMKILEEPSYTKNMPPQKVLELTRYVARKSDEQDAAYIAQQKKFDKIADDREKLVEETTAKDLFDKQAVNELTLDDVQSNRDNLSQTDYKYFLNELSGVKSKPVTNTGEYGRIYALVETNPQEAREDAKIALFNGSLTIADFKSLDAKATAEMDGDIPTPYKQGTKFLRSVARMDDLQPPEGAGVRFANAGRDFDQWFTENPRATAIEATDKAEEIWTNYQMISTPAMLGTALPYSFVGDRKDVALVDLQQGKKDLEAQFANGKINPQQYEKQKKILLEWAKYLKSKK